MGTEKQKYLIDPPDLPREDERHTGAIDGLSDHPIEAKNMAKELQRRYQWTFAQGFPASTDDVGPFVMHSSDSNMSYLISQVPQEQQGSGAESTDNQTETHTYKVGKGWEVAQGPSDEPNSAEVIPMDHAIIVGEVGTAINAIPEGCDNPLVHVRDFLYQEGWIIKVDSTNNPQALGIIVSMEETNVKNPISYLKYYISYDSTCNKFTIRSVQNHGVDTKKEKA